MKRPEYESIEAFLGRPLRVISTSWTGSDAVASTLLSWSSSSVPSLEPWASKLKGFRTFSADIEFKIVISASPQQQGALYVKFEPMQDGTLNQIYAPHEYDLCTISQLPGLTMQTCHKEATLRFPLRTPTNVISLSAPGDYDFTWGTLKLFVLDTLKTGSTGSSTAQVSLFVSFKNVKLGAPTVPQSGVKGSSRKVTIKRSLKPIHDQELEEEGEGYVSGPLLRIKDAAESLSGIPALSGIMRPTMWATDLLAKTAKSFGFSKPNSTAHEMPMAALPHISSYNADSTEMSIVLATSKNNEIIMMDDIPGYDQDEMSIDFIKSQFAYVKTISVNTSSNDYIDKLPIGPTQYNNRYTFIGVLNPVLFYSRPPIGMLGEMFGQFRGSLLVRIRFIKTMFHSGTLSFTYIPANYTPTSLSNEQQSYALTEIVDLSMVDEVTLRLPYLSAFPYVPIWYIMGNLITRVINPIKAPDNVSSSISLIYEVAGGPDLEFAVCNTTSSTTSVVVPQSGMESECNEDYRDFGTVADSQLSIPSLSVGEKLVSIRQLLKSYQPVQVSSVGPGSKPTNVEGRIMDPAHFGCYTYSATMATNWTGFGQDYYEAFAPCFLFRRGSVKLRLFTTGGPGTIYFNYDPTNHASVNSFSNSSGLTASIQESNSLRCTAIPTVHTGASLTFPHLSPYFMHLNIPFVCTSSSDNSAALQKYSNLRPFRYKYFGSESSPAFSVARAVGEDFQFGYWLGVPIQT